MNKYAGVGRILIFALIGVALGVAIGKLSGGSLVAVLAIVTGCLAFWYFRMRSGR